MEYHEIGEKFEFNGIVLEVIGLTGCRSCYFNEYGECKLKDDPNYCGIDTRNDKRSISYKLIEQCKPKDMEQKETKKIDGMSDGDWSDCEEPTPPAFMVKNEDGSYSVKEQSDEEIYGSLLDKLFTTYKAKDADYGIAFAEMFDELGIDYAYGKLREKMNRIKVLRKQPNMVENEGLEDALLDTAGYAILTLVELKKRKE